ncbi:MAG TPA: phosphoribosylanthranilate isomerase [Anaerohalosphaeraceae bacterium]|nr:phosphoribosylanthranilate isomerase [Anaerohalosphaeraceae bacterium]HRT51152.1 phosphoribosylanthranilate isomerase [Anaerohalosphaeraceae bacterium]HRT87205.1 phosphoribosylanthranilate isomerase [Anaerohalosphaeraceae bacterium]
MNSLKVKICGITNLEDARAAVDAGADMLGFNFYPESPRYLTVEQAIAILDEIPTFVDTVGVFVNPTTEQLKEITSYGFLSWIQLHGDETPEFCDMLNWLRVRSIKAIRVRSAADIEQIDAYRTDAILLDTHNSRLYGGTGEAFDWSLIGDISTRRIFLAGGITPENVADAAKLGVYGIDVCSGIESAPGKKDHARMKQLFDNLRHV